MKCLIIYHKEDNDGVFSAAIAATYVKKSFDDVDFTFLPSNYVTLSKVSSSNIKEWASEYDSIIMTDISFNDPKMMKALWDAAGNKLIWIDHHKPIIQASFGKNGFSEIPGEREVTRSAILLAWKFFFDPIDEAYNNGTVPYILRILSAWDSFTFVSEGIDKDFAYDVNTGVTNYYKLRVGSARKFIEGLVEYGERGDDVTYLMEVGHTINKARKWKMECLVEEYGDFNWIVGGVRSAVAVFVQESTSSLDFAKARGKALNAIAFKRTKAGQWTVSLYNIDDTDTFDCGAYMKAYYKGGGHIGAAGCTLSEQQFIDILKKRSI